jgi:hypothetical protein
MLAGSFRNARPEFPHIYCSLKAWFFFMATLNNKNGKRTYCHPWKGLLGIEIQLKGTMSQSFDLRILILYKTGAPLSQIIMVSTIYFSSKIRRVLPNFMNFPVFNNAGKEKPNIRRGADILN